MGYTIAVRESAKNDNPYLRSCGRGFDSRFPIGHFCVTTCVGTFLAPLSLCHQVWRIYIRLVYSNFQRLMPMAWSRRKTDCVISCQNRGPPKLNVIKVRKTWLCSILAYKTAKCRLKKYDFFSGGLTPLIPRCLQCRTKKLGDGLNLGGGAVIPLCTLNLT